MKEMIPMARVEPAIFTNMCMITQGEQILVINRRKPDWPGVTFPGGHVEPGESFVDSVIREIQEETGLTIENPTLCGVKQFPTKEGARYVLLFFRADRFTGELQSSDEGEVFWIPRTDLSNYSLAPDFTEMVHVMESDNLSEFYYYKENDSWKIRLL